MTDTLRGEWVVDPLVGRVFGDRYRIVRPLAAGGMGRVYVGEQLGLDRTVAIKVLAVEDGGASVSGSTAFPDRFFREAKLGSRLTHPNTVRIFDYGRTDDNVYFIAMEYLEGPTLGETLNDDVVLAPLRVIAIATQVCASLSEAHSLGLIDRDLKPANLILTRQPDGTEFLKVVDFGIAKDLLSSEAPTAAGAVYGSPAYMSPEQVVNGMLSPRSDIYAIGALLYRMATGAAPFAHFDPVISMTRQVMMRPRGFATANPELEVQRTLEWVTLQCLAKDPDERFASTEELARALKVCELELRGLIPPVDPLPSLVDGRLVISDVVHEALLRFGGADTFLPEPDLREPPAPAPARSPQLLVALAGMAVLAVAFLLAAGLFTVVAGAVYAGSRVSPEEPEPPAAAVVEVVVPEAVPADPGTPEEVPPLVAEPAPVSAPPPARSRDSRPVRVPVPVPAPAAEPAPVAVPPAPPVEPPPDPSRVTDLRNPYDD